MFGRYYHALTAHAALVNRIISPRLLNAEVEGRTFGQCKAVTMATSNQHTDHILSNILVRLHCEKKKHKMITQLRHLASTNKPTPPVQSSQHKINVLKRVLNHEWNVDGMSTVKPVPLITTVQPCLGSPCEHGFSWPASSSYIARSMSTLVP